MTPSQYARAFLRFWWLVVVCAVIGLLVAISANALTPARYDTSRGVYLSGTPAGEKTPGDAYQTSLLAQQRAISYGDMASGDAFADQVLEAGSIRLSRDELERRVTYEVPTGSSVIHVRVEGSSRAQAKALVTTSSTVLTDTIKELEKKRGKGTALLSPRLVGARAATMVAPAPAWRSPTIAVAAGVLFGLALAASVARLSPPVRDQQVLREVTGAPVLATVPRASFGRRGPGAHRRARAWESVRTSLFFLRAPHDGGVRIALVTPRRSAVAGDLARATAIGLGELDSHVVVVLTDPDAHQGRQWPSGQRGLLDHLLESGSSDVPLVQDPAGFDVIPAGTAAPGLTEALHTDRFDALLARLTDEYDHVLVLTPAADKGSGAAAVSARCDATVLVIDRRTTVVELETAARDTTGVGAQVAGAVYVG